MSGNKTSKARSGRAAVAAETLQILQRGHYRGPSGPVYIGADLDEAVRGTKLYTPGGSLPLPTGSHRTQFEVANETTLQGIARLVAAGHNVAALNFASARNPGGGFQRGSQAQEESLARCSGLFACIDGSEMYSYNRSHRLPLYSDHMIYSPGVPIFRDDSHALLPAAHRCAFVTAPAVNCKVAEQKGKRRQIEPAMRNRVSRLLSVMALHGHDTIVLGAWGCGVFRNDPGKVAGYFDDALTGVFNGAFARVVFSIPDRPRGRFIQPFVKRFG